MKRSIAILLLLATLITPASAKKSETPEEKAERLAIEAKMIEAATQPILEPVFTKTDSNHYLPDGTPTDTAPSGSPVAHTDAAGNLWLEEYFDAGGNLTGYTVHQFDVDFVPQRTKPGSRNLSGSYREETPKSVPGYVLLETQSYDNQHWTTHHEAYKYDNLGRKTYEVRYTPSGNIDFSDTRVYLAENLVYREYATMLGVPYLAFVTWYQDNGEPARSIDWNPCGNWKANITEIFYDEEGHVIEEIQRGTGKAITERTVYLTGEYEKWDLYYTLGADGSLRHGSYPTFDENGRLIELERDSYATGTNSTRYYTYDEDGFLRLEEEYRYDGTLMEQVKHLKYSEFLQNKNPGGDIQQDQRVYIHDDETWEVLFRLWYWMGELGQTSRMFGSGYGADWANSISPESVTVKGWATGLYDEEGNGYGNVGYDKDGAIRSYKVVDKTESWNKVMFFNENGLTHQETYYDESGREIGYQEWINDEPQAIHRRVGDQYRSYVRDEKGVFYLDQLTQYNADGDQTAYYVYDADGTVREDHQYYLSYDEAGNLTSQYHYLDGELQDYTLNTWGRIADMPLATGLQPQTPEPEDSHYREYDENGNVTLELQYNAFGEVVYRTESTYNRVGNPLTVYRYDDGIFIYGREYEYDKDGLELERHCLLNDGRYSKQIKYRGPSTKEYTGNGETLTRETEYAYDNKHGRLERKTITDYKDDKPVHKTVTTYNQRGDMTALQQYDVVDGEELLVYEATGQYEYNREAQLLEYIEHKNGVITSKEMYSYNADGLLSRTMVYDGEGKFLQRVDRAYGAYENSLWTQTTAADGTVLERIDFFYDANGELIGIK